MGDTTNLLKVTMKIISASSKIILAVLTMIKCMFVIIHHGTDIKHSASPKPIPTRCDSILRIIVVRVLAHTLMVLKKRKKEKIKQTYHYFTYQNFIKSNN